MQRGLLIVGLVLSACSGDPSSSASAPIIGGALDGADPSAVLIGGGGGWCSGTLIAPKVVLTAGHCISPKNNFVYFGPQYLGDAGGSSIPVAQSYTNPGYSSASFRDADIGIVILPSPSNVTPSAINTVALDASYVGKDLHVVGFGATANPTEPSFTKMDVTVPVGTITAKEITTGPAICEGDSGGPAMLTVGGTPVVAGVTSWHSTQSCGGEAGFARVDLYAQWIEQQIALSEVADAGATDDGAVAVDAGAADAAEEQGGSAPVDTSGCTLAAGPGHHAGFGAALALIAAALLRRRRDD